VDDQIREDGMPDNAAPAFKCSQCGAMFNTSKKESECPICGYICTPATCRQVDASDEGY
jgi:rubrerythrin